MTDSIEVGKLARVLDHLIYCGRCLTSADNAISNKRQGHFPRPEEADYRLAQSDEPLDGDNAFNGAWPMILRRTSATLREWQRTLQDAREALGVLPKEASDVLSAACDRPHWNIRLAKLLNSLHGNTPETTVAWVTMGRRLPNDWPEQINTLGGYADELLAIVNAGTKSQPATAAENAPAQAAGKAHKPTVNARMFDMLSIKPESQGWSAQQWADHLGCGKSSVAESAAWISLRVVKADAKIKAGGRPADRRRKAKPRSN